MTAPANHPSVLPSGMSESSRPDRFFGRLVIATGILRRFAGRRIGRRFWLSMLASPAAGRAAMRERGKAQ
jgi:hypothetical protein